MVEAKHYRKLGDGTVQCLLCPHHCTIAPGKRGRCRVRANQDGMLMALSYGQLVSLAVDPIEKKPLFHFHPGKDILSTGPNGCNLSCRFCQNWEISQAEVSTRPVPAGELAALAAQEGSIGIAYTYTEPLVWFEYLLEACARARERGLVNVLVTNGTIDPAPLAELLPLVDAMNVDLKGMDPQFYRETCGGDLATVLATIERAKKSCWVEVTNLVVPGLNDSPRDRDALIDWACRLDPLMPVHFSRYFPQYRLRTPPTPEETLRSFYERAKERLAYVYVGNIRIPGAEDTRCPQCGNTLITRHGYHTTIIGIDDKKCSTCRRPADIIGL